MLGRDGVAKGADVVSIDGVSYRVADFAEANTDVKTKWSEEV